VTSRVAVVGDVGGHLAELRAELRRLGADPDTGRLPDDLTVVQVGDLVHRGPDSDGVVDLVARYLDEQPAQWRQLVGNHEAQYLRHPLFEWPEQVSARSRDRLRGWWADGRMRVAAAVSGGPERLLVTHAGVTEPFWREVLGAPADADRAAELINAMVGGDDEDALFRPGVMLGRTRGRWRSRSRRPGIPGPIWAATATELLPGWLPTTLPFSQVHGHDTFVDWRYDRYRLTDPDEDPQDPGPVTAELARRTVLDAPARHETTTLDGGRIIGVDPGHGVAAAGPWRAWEG
jgi:hypothetical protein